MMMARLKQFYDKHIGLPIDPDAAEPGVVGRPIHTHPGLMAIVFIGGCLGTLARYGVTCMLPHSANAWPFATVTVNLIGAFALGVILQALFNHGSDQGKRRLLRLGLGTGFLGAFTTYSTFAVETSMLLKHGQINTALFYMIISLVGGILLSAFGIFVATKHHHRWHVERNI